MNNDSKYINLSTKVNSEVWVRFNQLCNKLPGKPSPYEMIQLVVETLVRYMDDEHQLTPEMETIIHVFESLNGWKDAFNIADPSVKPQVSEATYYLDDAEGKKQGVRAVLVRQPFMGQASYTYNIQTIAERMFCLTFPDLYKRLRRKAVVLNTSSVIHTIEELVQQHGEDEDAQAIREMFSDARRGDFGQTFSEHRYKQTKTKDMNTLFDDGTL